MIWYTGFEGPMLGRGKSCFRDGAVVGGDISAGGNQQFVHSLLLSQAQRGEQSLSPSDGKKK